MTAVQKIKLQKSFDIPCGGVDFKALYADSLIKSFVEDVEQLLKLTPSETVLENVKHLESAADMFLYLNTCPAEMRPWFEFYKNLFLTQSVDNILLTLNRMTKGNKTPRNDFFKSLAQKLFKRAATLFPIHYGTIQNWLQLHLKEKNTKSLPAGKKSLRECVNQHRPCVSFNS